MKNMTIINGVACDEDNFGYLIAQDGTFARLFLDGVFRGDIVLKPSDSLEEVRSYIFEFKKPLMGYR